MSLTVTILGCGSSGGVPRVGQGWGACNPADPRNRRRRCSILVEKTGPHGTTTVLVDTSPDVREQLLDANVSNLDAVLFTHAHADHMHGIDDLRPLSLMHDKRIDIYADESTLRALKKRFGYCFETPSGSSYPPILTSHRFSAGKTIIVNGAGGIIEALPFRQHHGDIDSFGFRFEGIAYSSDINAVPEQSHDALQGLDVWIVDALRERPHPSHFCLQASLDHIAQFAPRQAVLTNMHTDFDFQALSQRLPEHVVPAYDGMKVESR
ncbi:MBL fold metallo-hydrolase [Xanthobacter sp. TB0139]|uniref:MBL fold metallo-hydrolase n=1 Tax=Xanthobacter sp. TB0139 TaxID=3459178 RepID=UPI0040397451